MYRNILPQRNYYCLRKHEDDRSDLLLGFERKMKHVLEPKGKPSFAHWRTKLNDSGLLTSNAGGGLSVFIRVAFGGPDMIRWTSVVVIARDGTGLASLKVNGFDRLRPDL